MKRKRIRFLLAMCFVLVMTLGCSPELFYHNSGVSTSSGSPKKGSIENSWLMDYRLDNARYFSWVSYYLLDMGYLHSKLYKTLHEAYEECETSCPGVQFRLMECGRKKGGKTLLHRTHQSGLSVDFMVPKQRKGKPYYAWDRIGLWHYLLQFDSKGRLKIDKEVQIDFETMAKHIIALDNAARKNGLRVKKVILKIDLKDDFYATPSGKEVKRRGIYFAKHLSSIVDKLHDDHYHVDFALRS